MIRKQFTFYRSFFESIENLRTNKEKLQAFEILCGYALDHREPDLSAVKPSAATVFMLARPTLDRAHGLSAKAKKLSTVYSTAAESDRLE